MSASSSQAGASREAALRVVTTLRERGFTAYFVGGCVRDLVLGQEPADYDVATNATPDQVMTIFPRTIAVGAQFGVVLVLDNAQPDDDAAERVKTEVATYRADVAYSDGRHPDAVRYAATPQEDVIRRDFTINGLLLDPLTDEVLDFVGGKRDIEQRLIRTIGDPRQRFAEDKLRMMRAVRFAARLGYTIEEWTFAAIRDLAAGIHQVSCERIRDELDKMLTEGHAARAFTLLDETGLLKQVLPEIAAMKGVEQPPQYHPEGDVWTHTLLLLDGLERGCSNTLAWGVLLHDVGKPPTFRVAPDRIRFDNHADIGAKMAEEICRRLRMPNHDVHQIVALVSNHMRFADVKKMRPATLKRFLRLGDFSEHLELHRLDCRASHGMLDLYDFAREQFHSIPEEQIRPTPLLTGHDLIAAGFPPGPDFKHILEAVEDAQLEGTLTSREEALSFVETNFAGLRSTR